MRLEVAAALSIVLTALGCASATPEPDDKPDGPPQKPAICAVESPELCLQDGIDLYNGLRGTKDRDAARSKFELSCAGGDQRGCTWLGIALTETTSSGPEQARAVRLWDEACATGVTMACTQLGAHLMSLGWQQAEGGDTAAADETFRAANARLKRACGAGDDEVDEELWGIPVRGYACGLLASSYEHGFGVQADPETAFRLNATSCTQGWARSCAQQGYFFEHGIGVAPQPEQAAELYASACDQGDAMGCTHLAVMLQEGRGVQADPQRARALLQRACDAGYPDACERLDTPDD